LCSQNLHPPVATALFGALCKNQDRGVAAPPAAKLLSAQKLAKRRPTLSRLLRRFPVPNS
jgi:hypothetical protein